MPHTSHTGKSAVLEHKCRCRGKRAVGDGYFVEDCYLRRIIMTLEWEWDNRPHEILYDFTKLLVSKTPPESACFLGSRRSSCEVA